MKFSNVHNVELDKISGSSNASVSIDGIVPSFTAVAASFSIDNKPYAVVNCFSNAADISQLSSDVVTSGALSCAVVKYVWRHNETSNAYEMQAEVIHAIPSTLARGALMLQDNASFYLVAADGRLMKYAYSSDELQFIGSIDATAAARSIIVDSKPLDSKTFAVTLSSHSPSGKPTYSMQQLSIDFDSGDCGVVASFEDINCPSEVLKSSS